MSGGCAARLVLRALAVVSLLLAAVAGAGAATDGGAPEPGRLVFPDWPAAAPPPARAAAVDADGVPTLVLGDALFCARLPDADPTAGCDWTPVALAHVWRGERGTSDAAVRDGWFRVRFHLDAVPRRAIGIYVVAFNRSGRLYVNGHYMREFGRMAAPLPLNWNRAQMIVMPPSQLRAGDNEIEVQQRAYAWEHGWLSPLRLGPEEAVRGEVERRRFWQNELVRILGASTASIGVFFLIVWSGRRDQAQYFWFGCASLVWTAISLDYVALFPPLPARLWERTVIVAQVLRAVTMCVFVLRYAGQRRPRLEAAMWAYFLVGAAAHYGHLMAPRVVDLWFFTTLAASLWFLALLVREGYRRSRAEGTGLAVAGGSQVLLSGYDLWLFAQHSWTDRVYLAHFSAAVYLAVVGFALMRRFVDAFGAHERLAAVLEERVAAKAREVERHFEELEAARRGEALALERSRIMSEMHDGIGSQLTLALSLVRGTHGEDARVATVLRESIEDLQLIIDSLEPVENDLLTVLGTLRYRVQDRLSQSGIALHWNVVDLPPLPLLTPQGVLSVLRILQEAFANCLKHSGATTIAVSTALAGTPGVDETACIAIVDDGRGIDGGRQGRGLENMRRRAAALGGKLRITSRPGCTEVRLEIPTLREPQAA